MANESAIANVSDHADPTVNRITVADVWAALSEGWDDFMSSPTQLVFLVVIYPVIGFIAAYAAAGGALLPLVWPLVSGFSLVGPVAALGIYELSRRREQGLPVSWLNAFDVLRSPSLFAIIVLGVMLLAIFVAWIATARGIYHATLGPLTPASISAFVSDVFHTSQGRQLIVIGNCVGLVFAAVVLALTVVSFPLLLDRQTDPGTAVRTSVRAVFANPVPMALWGLIVAVLLLLGSLPFFVGLAVALPVLGHATWHLYRKVVAA